MLDVDIRLAVIGQLERTGSAEDRIRSELGLCLGATRVDVAVINGALHGYEIKSPRDTLARLASQVDLYGQVLDTATIVTSGKHVEHIEDHVPTWWGVWIAVEPGGKRRAVKLQTHRPAGRNPSPDPLAIAQLLWRDEAADALADLGHHPHRRATRWQLWDQLAELPLPQLQGLVRAQLKARPHWPGG